MNSDERLAVALRKMQLDIADTMSMLSRIQSRSMKAQLDELHEDYHCIGAIAWALDEGRLEIGERTAEHEAAQAEFEMTLFLGPDAVDPHQKTDGDAQ